jgi:hypothetical protein
VVDEAADDEDDGGGEAEGVVAVVGSPVDVAAELAVVGPPGVGSFDDPAQPEADGWFLAELLAASGLDDEVVEAVDGGEPAAYDGVVVAARSDRRPLGPRC